MERTHCAERATMLRQLSEQAGTLPLLREGYLRLAEELERKLAELERREQLTDA